MNLSLFQLETTTPESTGISSASVTSYIEHLSRRAVPMHSLLIMHHNKLIAEGYYAPYQADTLHRMYSITKSFTAIAIGLLAAAGRLGLDDRIIDYFPEKLPAKVHPYMAEMTLRHMLMMRTCHNRTAYKLNRSTDWVESFFTAPPAQRPGQVFHYDTSAAHTLGALVEKLTGQPLLVYLKEKCLNELAFSSQSYMFTDPFGISLGGSGLVTTPLDLLKFGYLIAHQGLVNGKQLVPADFIRTATACHTPTPGDTICRFESFGYGYQFWRTAHNGYGCYGAGGQHILFYPEQSLILVTTANTLHVRDGNQAIHDGISQFLLPAAQERPRPENPEAFDTLKNKLRQLKS